tara:strand:- start:824 stop:1327 length:504 start_codon:yes stop_codon:yes gene_type:complete
MSGMIGTARSRSGVITSAPLGTSQPAFLATLTAESDLAYNDDYYLTGTEIFDNGNNLAINAVGSSAGSSGCVFTAPVTGRYQINYDWTLADVPTDLGYYWARIVTSNRYYNQNIGIEPNASNNYLPGSMSVLVDMDTSDYCQVLIHQHAGTTQADFSYGSFSGFLVA